MALPLLLGHTLMALCMQGYWMHSFSANSLLCDLQDATQHAPHAQALTVACAQHATQDGSFTRVGLAITATIATCQATHAPYQIHTAAHKTQCAITVINHVQPAAVEAQVTV